MKKLFLILFFIMFIPFYVNAKTCDSSSIKLESIELNSSVGNAEEVNEPTISGKKIKLDIKLYDPGDSIEYSIKVRNDSSDDLYFDEESLKLNTDYLEYEFIYDDNSNFIKSGEDKIIKLRVNYKNKVPANVLTNEVFNDTNNMVVNLSNKNTLINPNTGRFIFKYLFIIIITIVLIGFVKRKSDLKYMIIVIGIIIVPLSVHALCKCNIELESKILIDGKEAYFLTGPEVNIKMKQLAGDDTSSNGELEIDENIKEVIFSRNEPDTVNKNNENIVSLSDSPHPIYMWYDNGIIYWWSEDKSPNMNENSSKLFCYMNNLSDINGVSTFDTSNTTDMRWFFYSTDIKNVNALSSWNTSNVTDMTSMFSRCLSLINLNGLSNWDVSNVSNMSNLFSVTGIVDVDGLSKWDTSKVETIENIFSVASSLINLDGLSNWNTSNITNMEFAFNYDTSLSDASGIKNWDVSKVKSMRQLFCSDVSLEELDLSKWNTASLENMINIFGMWTGDGKARYDSKLKHIYLSDKFDTSKVITMSCAFSNLPLLENYEYLRYFNTSNVEDVQTMFQANYNLKDLSYFKDWDVSKIINYRSMFNNSGIQDASAINNWNINSEADFKKMFSGTSTHPEFTKISGTWNDQGTFIPD